MCVCVCVCICRIAVAPLSLATTSSPHHKCSSPVRNVAETTVCEKVNRKRLSLRELLRSPMVNEEAILKLERMTPHDHDDSSLDDDISTIELVGEVSNKCSLQGHPRSRDSPPLSSAVSGSSARNSEKSTSSVGDYRQNFPYEPPRQQVTIQKFDGHHHSKLRKC